MKQENVYAAASVAATAGLLIVALWGWNPYSGFFAYAAGPGRNPCLPSAFWTSGDQAAFLGRSGEDRGGSVLSLPALRWWANSTISRIFRFCS